MAQGLRVQLVMAGMVQWGVGGAAIMSNLQSGNREPDVNAAAQSAFLSAGEASSPLNLSGNILISTHRGVSPW